VEIIEDFFITIIEIIGEGIILFIGGIIGFLLFYPILLIEMEI